MRTLVVGAGAVGGYFGGRLAQAGRDVTFLVRAKRAGEINAKGLQIVSPHGDLPILYFSLPSSRALLLRFALH